MPRTIPVLNEDHAHILLDAVNALRAEIDITGRQPWDDYDNDPGTDDPKLTREGYLKLLDEVQAFGSAVLEA